MSLPQSFNDNFALCTPDLVRRQRFLALADVQVGDQAASLLQQFYAHRHSVTDQPFDRAANLIAMGYLGVHLDNPVHAGTITPDMTAMLGDPSLGWRMRHATTLAFNALAQTHAPYTPALCTGPYDADRMATNGFAHDILVALDDQPGLSYTPQQNAAFHTLAEICGDAMVTGADNRVAFVTTLEQTLRRMGQLAIGHTLYPDSVLTYSAAAAGVTLPYADQPVSATLRVDDPACPTTVFCTPPGLV